MKNFDIRPWGGWELLLLDSDRIKESVDYVLERDIDGIWISSAAGYKLDNIRPVLDVDGISKIRAIVFVDGDEFDITGIDKMENLRLLSTGDNTQPLDISAFPFLEELRQAWHPKLKLSEENKNLRIVSLRKYKPKSRDLEDFSPFRKLEELSIIQSPMNSLQGIGGLGKLKKLELYYLRNLEYLDEIEKLSNTLEIFWCENIPKLKNHDYVREMEKLQKLAFLKCGEMPSIKFIEDMPNLRFFSFGGTNVKDGDMSSLVRLDFAGFDSKKHYSHSFEQIQEEIKNRNEKE